MNKDERKALGIVMGITESDLSNYVLGADVPYNAIQTTLCYIDKLQKENKELEKTIDLMVKEIATAGKSIEIINLYNNVSPDIPIYDLVKEYFYKKAEE